MIELDFDPEHRIEDFAIRVDAMGERSEHLSPVLWDIVHKIMNREARMFETRGASSGVYWSPLKSSTRKRKAGSPFPLRPLWREGLLRDSLSVQGAEYQILDVDDDGFTFGTSHPAAEYHVTGTRHMPPRPPLIIPKKHAREYIKDVAEYVFEDEVDD